MSDPVVLLTGLTRSFEQGGVRIDVLKGVNLEATVALADVQSLPVIASGGGTASISPSMPCQAGPNCSWKSSHV